VHGAGGEWSDVRRILTIVLLAAVVGPLAPARAEIAGPTFDAHRGPGRDYWLFTPSGDPAVARPLVIYLHGCSQTAEDAARGTRWNELAEREGALVVYPEQSPAANGAQCWNWFEPDHQVRGNGEPAIIMAIVAEVMAARRVDLKRVYAIGASAGADMATILGATYPDVLAAIAPFAGCAYLTCADVTGEAARAAMGSRERSMPAMVVQGTADPLNNVVLGESAVRQWLGTNRLDPTPTSTEDHGDPSAVEPGSGDPCVRNRNFPCAGGALGWSAYPATVHHHADERGCVVVDAWYVHGLSHDYPSGDPEGSFTDPIGPDLTAAAWSFFQAHRVGAPCGEPVAG